MILDYERGKNFAIMSAISFKLSNKEMKALAEYLQGYTKLNHYDKKNITYFILFVFNVYADEKFEEGIDYALMTEEPKGIRVKKI